MTPRAAFLVAAAALAGCVDVPASEAPPAASPSLAAEADYQGLDPGAQRLDSLHFQTAAYGAERAKAASETAERLYARIMADLGVYSFMPSRLYPLVVYADHAEFVRKTGLPEWSGGVSVGRALYIPDGPRFGVTAAHEMTHLVFNEFMGRADPALRWVNEGLAVYEEQEEERLPRGRPSSKPIPFREMAALAPLGERDVVVADWYAQVGSVARFMVERGGRVGMGEFLKALREGRPLDDAVKAGFPGTWDGAAALEAAWTASR